MEQNTIWFILIAILFTGYFVLEGFDMGVGILLPYISKDDRQRRVVINTIGPHWDGNEVWLLTAGGAMFAAFPNWYATLFSGFYLPLLLILLALIIRGVAFEFRSKDDNPLWRTFWDWAICIGSLIPALLWGVAFANILRGVPIDNTMNYVGGFWNLLNPYALLGGLVSLSGFTLLGAMFLSLKTGGTLCQSAKKIASRLWVPVLVLLLGFFMATLSSGNILNNLGGTPIISSLVSLITLLCAGGLLRSGRSGWAFLLCIIAVASSSATIFLGLFPRLMISSLDSAWDLTIYNSASGPMTLQVMTIVALVFVPIVLAYQAWSYWLFRKRVSEKVEALEY